MSKVKAETATCDHAAYLLTYCWVVNLLGQSEASTLDSTGVHLGPPSEALAGRFAEAPPECEQVVMLRSLVPFMYAFGLAWHVTDHVS